MDDKKIAFIMCVNDELYEQECMSYLARIEAPEGFCKDIITVREAESITSGYNGAMRSSDAKYKYICIRMFSLSMQDLSRIY